MLQYCGNVPLRDGDGDDDDEDGGELGQRANFSYLIPLEGRRIDHVVLWPIVAQKRRVSPLVLDAVVHVPLAPLPNMPLEATMMIIDNSEYMRNGDYLPTRYDAQADAVNVVFQRKTDSNPESSVGIMTMAGKA